jgi:hypothetical protein
VSDISPLDGLVVFYGLDLSGNQISNLSPLAGLSTLVTLRLANNQISDLSPLAGLTSVWELNLSDNQIGEISPLAGLTSANDIDLSHNQVSDLSPLAGIAIDHGLFLKGNQIDDISPLTGLTELHELGLADNQVSDLTPLEGMTHLTDLDLSDNDISGIHPLPENAGIGSGDTVLLEANPLNERACMVDIPGLQARGATVLYSCSFPMAEIPGGCFDMGDHFSTESPNPFPVHNVCITAFEMDFEEVTNEQYAECVLEGACEPPSFFSSATRPYYYGNPAYGQFPVIKVDWHQADAYCAWVGKRLPTNAEWEYAARGGLAGNRYPGGDTISGSDANYLDSGDPWDNDTSTTGYYAPNGYGLHDVAGNVWEWVNDWHEEGYYESSPTDDPPGPFTGWHKILRGGSWSGTEDDIAVGTYIWLYPYVDSGAAIGFRCARGGAY